MSVSSGSDCTIPIQDSPPPPPSPYANSGLNLNSNELDRITPVHPDDEIDIDSGGGGGVENKAFDPDSDSASNSEMSPTHSEKKNDISLNIPNEEDGHMMNMNGDLALDMSMSRKESEAYGNSGNVNGTGEKSKGELAEALNSELINLNILNSIPEKPDSNFQPYENFDEYFIPVNQHKKFLRRGEKLYVTKDKRKSSNWKKYCCWILGAFVLTTVITIAILAGLGLISQKSPSSTEGFFGGSSSTVAGTGGTSAPPRTTPTRQAKTSTELPPSPSSSSSIEDEISKSSTFIPNLNPPTPISDNYVPKTLDLQFILDNGVYEAALDNKSTSEFLALSSLLTNEIKVNFQEYFNMSTVHGRVLSFVPGSIGVNMRLGWEWTDLEYGTVSVRDVKKYLSTLKNIQDFNIRHGSISTYEVYNKCKISNGFCSHFCSFDYEQLDFGCSCPETLILNPDSQNCESSTFSSSLPEIPTEEEETPIISSSASPPPFSESEKFSPVSPVEVDEGDVSVSGVDLTLTSAGVTEPPSLTQSVSHPSPQDHDHDHHIPISQGPSSTSSSHSETEIEVDDHSSETDANKSSASPAPSSSSPGTAAENEKEKTDIFLPPITVTDDDDEFQQTTFSPTQEEEDSGEKGKTSIQTEEDLDENSHLSTELEEKEEEAINSTISLLEQQPTITPIEILDLMTGKDTKEPEDETPGEKETTNPDFNDFIDAETEKTTEIEKEKNNEPSSSSRPENDKENENEASPVVNSSSTENSSQENNTSSRTPKFLSTWTTTDEENKSHSPESPEPILNTTENSNNSNSGEILVHGDEHLTEKPDTTAADQNENDEENSTSSKDISPENSSETNEKTEEEEVNITENSSSPVKPAESETERSREIEEATTFQPISLENDTIVNEDESNTEDTILTEPVFKNDDKIVSIDKKSEEESSTGISGENENESGTTLRTNEAAGVSDDEVLVSDSKDEIESATFNPEESSPEVQEEDSTERSREKDEDDLSFLLHTTPHPNSSPLPFSTTLKILSDEQIQKIKNESGTSSAGNESQFQNHNLDHLNADDEHENNELLK